MEANKFQADRSINLTLHQLIQPLKPSRTSKKKQRKTMLRKMKAEKERRMKHLQTRLMPKMGRIVVEINMSLEMLLRRELMN